MSLCTVLTLAPLLASREERDSCLLPHVYTANKGCVSTWRPGCQFFSLEFPWPGRQWEVRSALVVQETQQTRRRWKRPERLEGLTDGDTVGPEFCNALEKLTEEPSLALGSRETRRFLSQSGWGGRGQKMQ